MDTLHEDRCTCVISVRIVLEMRIFFRKKCREKQNMHFMFNNTPPENCAVYEIMWKCMVETDRPQMTLSQLHFACWITKATDTHSLYRGADKSLAWPGRKQAKCFCQNGVNFLRRLALQEEKLDDSSRLDVVQMCDIIQSADKSLARSGRKHDKYLSEWREFP